MKVIVVGGTGTIGRAVVKELAERHDIVIAGHQHGDVKVDIQSRTSIEKMYKSLAPFDAVVSAVGKLHIAPLTEMTAENYFVGINDKLMGQVNLVLEGLKHINDQGSFTLTSGILSIDPVRQGSSASMVNAAIDGFVRGAAVETPRGIRINAVSPTLVLESFDKYKNYFHGFEPVTAERVAKAFSKSVEGAQTGQVYKVGYV